MRKNPVSKIFDIPQFYYFQSGNHFSGSQNQNQFNYKILYGKENLTLQIWHGLLCSEKAEIEIEKTFPLEESGFLDMIHFLEETYQKEA
jgi:hypothetical protein